VARPFVTRMVTIELPWMDLQRVLSQDPLNPDTTAEKENIILHRAGTTPIYIEYPWCRPKFQCIFEIEPAYCCSYIENMFGNPQIITTHPSCNTGAALFRRAYS
jgi:hypothetical protein